MMRLGVLALSAALALFLFGCSTSSEPDDVIPPETFAATSGGEGWDVGYKFAQLSDGGYLCIGDTEIQGSGDLLIVKLDDVGDEVWSQVYGGSEYDYGVSVTTAQRGTIIALGYTASFGHGNSDVWLLHMDAQGDTLWTRTFGGLEHDAANSVLQTQDGGFAIVGYTTSSGAGGYDVWLIKTDADGNELWNHTYGGSGNDIAKDIMETGNGDLVITGYTNSFGSGNDDLWLIRTDSEGVEIWNQTYGGIDQERGNSVAQTSDGGIVTIGFTKSWGAGNADLLLIKTDAQGNESWNQVYGGTAQDYGTSVRETEDGGFAGFGYTGSFGAGMDDMWFIRADAQGDSLWTRTFGGDQDDNGKDIQLSADGGFACFGSTKSYGAGDWDLWLIKTDESGYAETSQ